MEKRNLLKTTFWVAFGILFFSACAVGQLHDEDAGLDDISRNSSQAVPAAGFSPTPQVKDTPESVQINKSAPTAEPKLPDNLFLINSKTAGDLHELAVVMPYFPGYSLISEDGRVGAQSGMDGITILDMATRDSLLYIPADMQDCAFGMDRYFRFNRDGSFIALAARNVIQVWEVGGGMIYETAYNSQTGIEADICGAETPQLALSPDGTLLAVTGVESGRQYFRVVDILTNRVMYEWNGRSDSLHGNLYNYSGLGFSQDGRIIQTFDPTRFFVLSGTAYEAFRFWSVESWQELDRNSTEVRNGFSNIDLLFALQDNSEAILIIDRTTGSEQARLSETACAMENPCDIKLSPQGTFAAVLDYSVEPVLYHGDVLATRLEIWDMAEQSLVSQSGVMTRNLDAVMISDEGGLEFISSQSADKPPDNSWWATSFNFQGLLPGLDGQIIFSPQQIVTSSDTGIYYPGSCTLDLNNLEIDCGTQFYSAEGHVFESLEENGQIVLKSAESGSQTNNIELDLPAYNDENWSLRVQGISEAYQTVFYCLDENKRNQNCIIHNYADGEIIEDVEDIYSLRFSSGGDYAAYINREEKALYLVDLALAKASKVTAYQSRAWLVNPAFGSSGNELVYMIQNLNAPEVLSLEWVNAEGANVLRRSNLDNDEIYGVSVLSWTNAGELVALGSDNGWIYLLESAKGKIVHSWQAHTDGLIGLTFSADSKMLISMGEDGRIKVWGVEK